MEDLDSDKLRDLGGALGLRHLKLRRMNNILDDMTLAWLNKEDNVLDKSGKPNWSRLVEALEKIGQKGVAKNIRNVIEDSHPNIPTKSKNFIVFHSLFVTSPK